jgi:hypothetical protein
VNGNAPAAEPDRPGPRRGVQARGSLLAGGSSRAVSVFSFAVSVAAITLVSARTVNILG